MSAAFRAFYPTALFYEIRNEVLKIIIVSVDHKKRDDIIRDLKEIIIDKTEIKWSNIYDFLDRLKSLVSSVKPLGANTNNENNAIESRLNELLVLLRSYRSSLRKAPKK